MRLELGQPDRLGSSPDPGGALELVDHRLRPAVAVVRQTLITQHAVALPGELLLERQHDPRLADPGLAGQHDHVALALARPAPALDQERALLLAADQRAEAGVQGLEAIHRAQAMHPADPDRLGEPLELLRRQVLAVEQIADQAPRGRADHDLARLRQLLQPGREVRRGADHRLLLGGALPDQIADHHEPGGDADPHLQGELGPGRQLVHRLHQVERGAHGALGILLVRLRVAEVRQHAVAHVLGDVAVVALDHRRAATLVGVDHGPHVFADRDAQRGRADQVGEQDGQLAASRLASRRDHRRPGTVGPGSRPPRAGRHSAAERGARRVLPAAGGTARSARQRVQNGPDRRAPRRTSGSSSTPIGTIRAGRDRRPRLGGLSPWLGPGAIDAGERRTVGAGPCLAAIGLPSADAKPRAGPGVPGIRRIRANGWTVAAVPQRT